MTKKTFSPQSALLNTSLDAAARSLADFVAGPVTDASSSIESMLGKSFATVATTIANTADAGKGSISSMVDAILADFDKVAAKQFVGAPIQSMVSSLMDSILPVSGARAAGGPVSAGQAYLVGEHGPEWFRPAGNGTIQTGASVTQQRPQIVLNVQARDIQSFQQSESQLAAMMARAMARGQRNM